jgi:7,8-dihydropterin-6-yl-methyl-4-(beta-D-ribofuranosyl)aminobenzene 5'-phosphate synthase
VEECPNHPLRRLGIDPSTVDAVFLSHDHRDHTGGMRSFLEVNPDVTVYLLPSFSAEIKAAATHRTRNEER